MGGGGIMCVHFLNYSPAFTLQMRKIRTNRSDVSRKVLGKFLPSDLADTIYADNGGSAVYGLSAATRLLELRVGNSPGTWMPVCC